MSNAGPPWSARKVNAAEDIFAGPLLTRCAPIRLRDVEVLVWEEYGIAARAERLTGERDDNYWLRLPAGASLLGRKPILKTRDHGRPAKRRRPVAA